MLSGADLKSSSCNRFWQKHSQVCGETILPAFLSLSQLWTLTWTFGGDHLRSSTGDLRTGTKGKTNKIAFLFLISLCCWSWPVLFVFTYQTVVVCSEFLLRQNYVETFLLMNNNTWVSLSCMMTLSSRTDLVCPSDESQATDNEICTITSTRVPTGTSQSTSTEGSNKGGGLHNTISCILCYTVFDFI